MKGKIYYGYNVAPDHLPWALAFIRKGDEMDGWQVESIQLHGSVYTLLVSRKYGYPFVENQLKEICAGNLHSTV